MLSKRARRCNEILPHDAGPAQQPSQDLWPGGWGKSPKDEMPGYSDWCCEHCQAPSGTKHARSKSQALPSEERAARVRDEDSEAIAGYWVRLTIELSMNRSYREEAKGCSKELPLSEVRRATRDPWCS